MNDVALIFYALLGIAWLAWALAITSRLADIRTEARRQTALLEEIARNTRPKDANPAPVSSVRYRIPGLNE